MVRGFSIFASFLPVWRREFEPKFVRFVVSNREYNSRFNIFSAFSMDQFNTGNQYRRFIPMA
jgi:hypothetical protein